MSKKEATPVMEGGQQIRVGSTLPSTDAERFLQLLGKDPKATWCSTLKPVPGERRALPNVRRGVDLQGFDAVVLEADNQAGEAVYFRTGDANQASGKGSTVRDADVTQCCAVFVEWDDRPLEWQVQAPRELGLPEPTAMVHTGGKSVHCYWRLSEPMPPDEWRVLQRRLIEYAGGDKMCKNPSRLMRLPGFRYVDKDTGKVTDDVAALIHQADVAYSAAEIEACIPATEQPPAPAQLWTGELPPRSEADLLRALERVPEFFHDQGRRLELLGLAQRLTVEWGADRAHSWLAQHSPTVKDLAGYFTSEPNQISSGSIWPFLHEHYDVDLKRHDLKRSTTTTPATPPAASQQLKQVGNGAAPASAPKRHHPLSMAEVGDRLREAITDGVGSAELAALVAELATAAEQGSINVQRLADAIRAEQQQAVEVHAEAANLAAEADRQESGQQITARFLLPASIAAAIEIRARYLPCDGASAVLPFLAAVAGLVGLGTEVEGSAVAGYRVPVNLFACLVGRSGAKKSPIGRLLVEAPTRTLRAEIAAENRAAMEGWKEACRKTKRGETKPEPPQLKRLVVSDYTGEALAAQLQTQEEAGLGLLINRDELSGLFGSINRYRGGRGDDEQQLLELFDGSGLMSLRIVGNRHYSRSQLSIWGSTQPDVLRKLVAQGDASGLWARFLFVPLPERAIQLPLATSADEVAEVEAGAQALADACEAVFRLPPQTYRLAPAAAERFANYELNRQRAALRATIGAQSALYGKSAGKVLRVAGVLHLLRIAAGEITNSESIEPDTIAGAAALVDHLDAWALGLHAEVAAGGEGGLMRTIHRAAESAGGAIRWKEIAQRLSRAQRKGIDPATAAEAMRALAAAGYGEVEAGKRGALSYRATRQLP